MNTKFFGFPLESILKTLIGYLSNVLENVAPDEIDEETKRVVQKTIGVSYAILKNVGPALVGGTETDLDDVTLDEFIEVAELAAKKYDLELNPENL